MSLTAHGTWKFKIEQRARTCITRCAGYCYRCPFGLEYPSCGVKCAYDIKNVIHYETPGEIACFIGEPIQGVGGTITPPKEFFKIVYDIVREHGGICIADEVQGGFGRTGHHYWAHQNWDVVPDMVTMAKGIGNGAPLGAMTTTRATSPKSMKNRVHFNTFGGNPISMTQGLATLEVIDEENIQQNALEVGTHLKDALARPAGQARAHRRSPRPGADARRRAGARPQDQGARQHRSGRRDGTHEGARRARSAKAACSATRSASSRRCASPKTTPTIWSRCSMKC